MKEQGIETCKVNPPSKAMLADWIVSLIQFLDETIQNKTVSITENLHISKQNKNGILILLKTTNTILRTIKK
jgi:translation initiation factor 2 alpha subunit (eIF-2alpha)